MGITSKIVLAFLLAVGVLGVSVSQAQGPKAKMETLKDLAPSDTATLKGLEADTKKLERSFNELLIKQGFTDPKALKCQTTCSVTCTCVNGKCQPTTTCSVTCS